MPRTKKITRKTALVQKTDPIQAGAVDVCDLDCRLAAVVQRLTMLQFALASMANAYDAHGAPSEDVMHGVADLMDEIRGEAHTIADAYVAESWQALETSTDPEDQAMLKNARRYGPLRDRSIATVTRRRAGIAIGRRLGGVR